MAKTIVDEFFSRFGLCLEIHTDQGKNFMSNCFTVLCELLQITKTRTTGYRPCSNGQIERMNRTVLQMIRCLRDKNIHDWDLYLPHISSAIRSTVNRISGFTPNKLMLGREVYKPVHVLFGVDQANRCSGTPAEYVVFLKKTMKETANMLQLNMDKTEVLVLMNKSLRNPITMNKIKIDSIDISTASSVRNLGVIFDSALSSEAFVNFICKSAWFNLFNISRSRRSLTTDAAKILIQSYVMSKIDYCNIVLRLHKFSHITPALATLHWLPVKRRIDFKITLLVYKALNGQAPAYIADLLQPYDPPWKLRSADKQLLSQPPCHLKSYGDRAFCCAAPVVWNNIPHSVKTARTVDNFKVKLKTHFYSVSFA